MREEVLRRIEESFGRTKPIVSLTLSNETIRNISEEMKLLGINSRSLLVESILKTYFNGIGEKKE